MNDAEQLIHRFAGFSLDLGKGRLRGRSGEIVLRPKSLDLLVYLVRNAGRVVPKGELMDAVWPDVTVTEDSLTQCVHDVRRALGDKGSELLRNVPRRGYVFIEEALEPPAAPAQALGEPSTTQGALPDRPSVVVLPFANMSSDPEQEFFVDGMVDDIITALSRFKSLFVIARNSAFAFKNRSDDPREVGRKLSVRYILEGSARRTSDRLRLTAQLIDAESGAHVWADRYDRELIDLLEVQDDLVRTVVSTVVGRIEVVGKQKVRRLSEGELRAYDLYLRAAAAQDRNTRQDYRQAREWLRQAIAEDPMLAQAHHHLSLVAFIDWMAHWTEDREAMFAEAVGSARQSLLLDDSNSSAQAHFGMLRMYGGEYDEAGHHFARSFELNPNDAKARALHGFYLTAVGRPDEAIAAFDHAARLDPFQPSWTNWLRGIAHFTARRYRDAIVTLKAIPAPMNEVQGWLAASYAYAGDIQQARIMLETFLAGARSEMASPPPPSIAAWQAFWRGAIPYRDKEDTAHLHEGLRRAGMAD